jgi:hypothetical protein
VIQVGCLTTILPAMTLAEAVETTPLHRVAGRLGKYYGTRQLWSIGP